MMLITTIIIAVLYTFTTNCSALPHNPCPEIFQYIREGNEWTGHITIPAPSPSKNIAKVMANFSIEQYITSYGPIKLDEYDKALEKIKNRQNLKYIVKFPKSKYLPVVTAIDCNGKTLCSGPPVSAPTRTSFWLMHLFDWTGVFGNKQTQVYHQSPPDGKRKHAHPPHRKHQEPEPPTRRVISNPKKFNNYKECGMIRKKRSIEDDDFIKRIINGTLIPRNSHPWLAALFEVTQGRGQFFCAGNLISNKHVLTAAHCTIVKNHANIQVRLGVHDTNRLLDPGSLQCVVKRIMEHPDYMRGNAKADIAFIVLENDVIFSEAIKPICLWNYDSNFQAIIGYLGIIMGWGIQENGESSPVPMQTDVTITTKQKCMEIDLLRSFVSDETFCAGRQGTGPCMGDSGGGLFIIVDGKWYLRGIISTSIADRYTQICDASTYSVYVDTAKYMNWIQDNME